MCRVALTIEVGNFNKHVDTMEIINLEAQRDGWRQSLFRNGYFHMMEVKDMG